MFLRVFLLLCKYNFSIKNLLEKFNEFNSKYDTVWFFKNVANVKLTEHGRIHKVFHVTDFENLLETDNLKEYINNGSF